MDNPFTLEYARALDRGDPLRRFRGEFEIQDPSMVYLDGNSLGRLPLKSAAHMEHAIRKQWGEKLIRSWNEAWYMQSSRLGKKIARIIGAHPQEVIVTDSTSVNLYKLAFGALRIREGKTEIISDDMNFPSDLYILQGLIRQFGESHSMRLLKSPDGISSDMTELVRMVNHNTALISLSHVAYKSAYMYDLERVTKLAHLHNSLILWDLSHSAGVVPVDLNKADVDLAVGCTYKYLNGGPGSPAFLYVRRDLQEQLENPIQGWFGEQNPFEFHLHYRRPEGIRKFLAGTPPVISQSGLEPALDMILEAGIKAIRQKSVAQSKYLLSLAKQWFSGSGFRVGSPALIEKRGSHISLKHAEAYRICKALNDPGLGSCVVIPDFREPNNIRFGISPLYTSYEDIFIAMMQLKEIIDSKLYKKYSTSRDPVT
ncbi:MAG: kynureninase [Bacteroidota bacterium]|nr:kynureninase [Bacteroidota bacterium]